MHESASNSEPAGDRKASAAASDALVAPCAVSAGIHAGLVPEHMHEAPALGASFIAAAVPLAGTGAALALRPASVQTARWVVVLLAGLIAAYAASRTAGIPLLAPRPEPADLVGFVSKAVEAAGLAMAIWLAQPAAGRWSARTEEAST